FEGEPARRIVQRAVDSLCKELPRQVMRDGSNYELSGAYHLQVMSIVSYAIVGLLSAGLAVPSVLVDCLEKMSRFAAWMRLPGGNYPMWNDSARDSADPLDEVQALANGILVKFGRGSEGRSHQVAGGLRFPAAQLLETVTKIDRATEEEGTRNRRAHDFLESPSDYQILRTEQLTTVFDAAATAPEDLPAH